MGPQFTAFPPAIHHLCPTNTRLGCGGMDQENRICLRSTVVFRWESRAAPVVSYSAWSLHGRILVLCAPLSVSRHACKISYSSRITHKATLHPPIYAGGYKVRLYISSCSPQCSFNLRRNVCSHRDARQVYIDNTAYYVHVCKARAVPVEFLRTSCVP